MSNRRGVMKWFNRVKGTGFIEPEDGTQDVYMSNGWANGHGSNGWHSDNNEQDAPQSNNGIQSRNGSSRRSFF